MEEELVQSLPKARSEARVCDLESKVNEPKSGLNEPVARRDID
jgi:hypothetical protein